jgi:hypothetical protein
MSDKRELRKQAARDEKAAQRLRAQQAPPLPEDMTRKLLTTSFPAAPLFLRGPLRPPSDEHEDCLILFQSLADASADDLDLREDFLNYCAADASAPSLSWVLSVLRNPEHYHLADMDSSNVSSLVEEVVQGLANAADLGWFFSQHLTRGQAAHLLAVSFILNFACDELCFEVLDKVLDVAGGREAAAILTDWLRSPVPARGFLAGRLGVILVGGGREEIADHSWVTADDISSACSALVSVLDDPRSMDETNGWVFHTIYDMMEKMPHHAALIWQMCGDAVRRADAEDRVDRVQVGGAEQLLYTASCSVWLATLTGEEHKEPFKFTLTNGVYVERDADGYKHNNTDAWKEQPGSWAFFLVEFKRSSLGIGSCRCPVPKPNLFCNFEAVQVDVQRAKKAITVAEQYAAKLPSTEAADVLRAVTAARVALSEATKIRSYSSSEKLKATAGLLLADALEAQYPLLPPAKAAQAAEEVVASLKAHLPSWLRYEHTRFEGIVRSHEEARAMLRSAKALVVLQKRSEAVDLGQKLHQAKMPPPSFRYRALSQSELAHWQAQAAALLRELRGQAPAAPSPAKPPAAAVLPALAALSVKDDAFPDHVQRWSWRSAGSQADPGEKAPSFPVKVLIVDRLTVAVFWLRGSLLVWDYCTSTVLTWIDGFDDDNAGWDAVDTPLGSVLIISRHRTGHSGLTNMILLDAVTRGSRLDLADDSTQFSVILLHFLAAWDTTMPPVPHWAEGTSPHGCVAQYVAALGSRSARSAEVALDVLRECAREIGSFFGATVFDHTSRRPGGGWALASGSAAATPLLIQLVVSRPAQCERAALLGPLAFPCLLRRGAPETRTVSLQGHVSRVTGLRFSRQGDVLVSLDKQLGARIWDVEVGECLLTLSDETNVQSMALSHGLFFSTLFDWSSSSPSHVKVFDCDAGSPNVGKALATITCGPANPQKVLGVVALDTTVCVAFKNGVLDIHSFPTAADRRKAAASSSSSSSSSPLLTHLRRLQLGALPFCSLQPSRSGTTLFVGASPYLYELQLPGAKGEATAAREWGRGEAERMNCAACGRYRGPDASQRCGGCRAARFCNDACLQAGWKDHKAACKAAAASGK